MFDLTLPRIWIAIATWLRQHSTPLFRLIASIVIVGASAVAAYTCHGFVGPPG